MLNKAKAADNFSLVEEIEDDHWVDDPPPEISLHESHGDCFWQI